MGTELTSLEHIIINYLDEYLSERTTESDVRYEVIHDPDKNHILLMRLGWNYPHYMHTALFHFEIIGNKVWILQNNTETLIASELVERGIAPSQIVLGFQPEHRRPHTGFAVA